MPNKFYAFKSICNNVQLKLPFTLQYKQSAREAVFWQWQVKGNTESAHNFTVLKLAITLP